MRPTHMVWTLPADAASVPLARHRVVSVLRAHGWNDARVDEVALMTTELATNAVEHAATPFTLVVELAGGALRVDVHDASLKLPAVGRARSPCDIRGRGLALVAAFSDRWGYEPDADGKSVWFESGPRPN